MRTINQNRFCYIGSFCLLILSGCASTPSITSQTALPKVVIMPSRNVEISSTCVSKEDNAYVVKGLIKRNHTTHTPIKGHIDISLMDTDGKTVKEVCMPFVPRLHSKSIASSTFTARVDSTGEQEDRIVVRYHNDSTVQ